MSKWTHDDTSDYTGDDHNTVTSAEHLARDHAVETGDLIRGDKSGHNSQRFEPSSKAGQEASGLWSNLFGSKK